jgi:hypothetical protein
VQIYYQFVYPASYASKLAAGVICWIKYPPLLCEF